MQNRSRVHSGSLTKIECEFTATTSPALTRSRVHASRKAETWALRFAKAIAAVARRQDRRRVLTWDVPRIGRDSESSFVDVAGLVLEDPR